MPARAVETGQLDPEWSGRSMPQGMGDRWFQVLCELTAAMPLGTLSPLIFQRRGKGGTIVASRDTNRPTRAFRVRRQGLEPRTRGLRGRGLSGSLLPPTCAYASPDVHFRSLSADLGVRRGRRELAAVCVGRSGMEGRWRGDGCSRERWPGRPGDDVRPRRPPH